MPSFRKLVLYKTIPNSKGPKDKCGRMREVGELLECKLEKQVVIRDVRHFEGRGEGH